MTTTDMTCTLGGAASREGEMRPAFQMCLARAVTGPERFKGGTCSFGAPAMCCQGLSRADSNGRYAVGAHIIARLVRMRQGRIGPSSRPLVL